MSAKCMDKYNRWRSKTVGFRVLPEEDALLEAAVRLSGLTKQDYIMRKLTDREVVVMGNPRVYKALKRNWKRCWQSLREYLMPESFIRIC